MKSARSLYFALLGLALTLPSHAAEIGIPDLTQTPTANAGPTSTDILTPNGGTVVNNNSDGPPVSLSYLVTTLTCGRDAQAQREAVC